MRIVITILVFQLFLQTAIAQLSIPSKKWGIGYGCHEKRFTGILFHSIANKEKQSSINGLNISLLTGNARISGIAYATIKNRFDGVGIGLSGILLDGYDCSGIFMTGFKTDIYQLMGISISPVNKIESFSAIVIGLVNLPHKKRDIKRQYFGFPTANKGLQIGLINHQRVFRGIQIGLININKSNRKIFQVLPFINVNFTKFSRY